MTEPTPFRPSAAGILLGWCARLLLALVGVAAVVAALGALSTDVPPALPMPPMTTPG